MSLLSGKNKVLVSLYMDAFTCFYKLIEALMCNGLSPS